MESWKDLLNPDFYITNGGLWIVLFIIFAETGLFVGFFLPETACSSFPEYMQLRLYRRVLALQEVIS